MTQIFLNRLPRTYDPVPATWGELLEKLDAAAAGEGVLLSAARFDGVDVPAFRESTLTGQSLAGVERVEVETAAPAALLRDCLLETVEPLENVAASARRLAAVYRGRDISPGHEGLTALAGELQTLTTLIDMVTGPVGLDLGAADGVPATQHIVELGAALDALVSAQAAEDWLTVADILEYDLEPAIRHWVTLLSQAAHQLA